jgi:hypothetical protein
VNRRRVAVLIATAALLAGVLAAAANAEIVGHVTDGTGAPAAGVHVSIYNLTLGAGFFEIVVSDAEGNYHSVASPGPLKIGFAVEEQGDTRYDPLPMFFNEQASWSTATVVEPPVGSTFRADAVVHRPGEITGRVTDPRGKPLPAICVQGLREGSDGEDIGVAETVATGASGDYRLPLERDAYSHTGEEGGSPGQPGEVVYDKRTAEVLVSFYRTEHHRSCSIEAAGPHTVPVYYKQKHTQAAADRVIVSVDATVPNIDAVLPDSAGCVVPHLVGKTVTAARTQLRKAGCALGRVTVRRVAGKRRGTVLSQSVRAEKHAPGGTRVSVVIS